MKTKLSILIASLLTVSAQQVGPTAQILVTNVTRSQIVLQMTTTNIIQRSRAPIIWGGKTNWLESDKVLSSHSVTNVMDRGGRPNRP